ncbi:MAG TPA: molybdopterin cofactor-binding domain-containing protein, partial [Gemmatimonadaceae bacterium]|nr:molybdopterin cofactor-binding domain-containing protein [Gemmatimonadaceae bacterium]
MSNPVSRRDFIRAAAVAGGGMLIAVQLPRVLRSKQPVPDADGDFTPNAWISLAPDGVFTISIGAAEMGQGVQTSIAMIAAEELDADWAKIRSVLAVGTVELERQGGGRLGTGGSRTIISTYLPMRRAAASARAMLVQAAATKWGVDPSSCATSKGVVTHSPTGRTAAFGELASAAALLTVPANVPLKNPGDFKIIGTRVPRVDTPGKVDGSAQFGIDATIPGLLVATLLRPPAFGATKATLDASKARAVPGVREVVETPNGVAVIADGYWQALQGQKALSVTWTGGSPDVSSATISSELQAGAENPAVAMKEQGTFSVPTGGTQVEATYELPFLAHAAM